MATLSKDVEADAEPVSSCGVSLLSNEATGGATGLILCDVDGLQRDVVQQFPEQSENEHQTSSVQNNNDINTQVPREMTYPHYDILLLHTVEDYTLAKEVKEHLENHEKIVTKDGKRFRVLLYTEVCAAFNQKIDGMEIGLKHSTYIFMLVTEAFTENLPTRFLCHECLWFSLNDDSKKWCFVPVFTDKHVKVTFGLNSFSRINYNKQDELYFDTITTMMNERSYLRSQREEEQKVAIQNYKRTELKNRDPFAFARTPRREQIDSITVIPVQATLSLPETTDLRDQSTENIDSSLTHEKTSCIRSSATELNETSDVPGVALDNSVRRNEPDGACKQTDPLVQELQRGPTFNIKNFNVQFGGKLSIGNVGEPSALDSPSCEAQRNLQESRNEYVCGVDSLLEKSLTKDDAKRLANMMSMNEADISHIDQKY